MKGIILPVVLLALALIGPWFWSVWTEQRSQEEWGILQSISAKHYGDKSTHLVRDQVEGYSAIGVLSPDKTERTWILLSPKYEERLKMLEGGRKLFSLTEAQLKSITATTPVAPEVLTELERHISR